MKRIMTGGPQMTVTAFLELGATSDLLADRGNEPSLPFQPVSPLSTVTLRLMSSRFAYWNRFRSILVPGAPYSTRYAASPEPGSTALPFPTPEPFS